MRMYGFLKTPYLTNRKDLICKVMLHETRRQGTFAYLYTSPEALFSSFDLHYARWRTGTEKWRTGRSWGTPCQGASMTVPCRSGSRDGIGAHPCGDSTRFWKTGNGRILHHEQSDKTGHCPGLF